jgi:hypothetical protein
MYMAPRIPSVRLSIQSNGFQGQMSADAAGITVCLFAFSLLSFEGNDESSLVIFIG